MDKCGSVIIVQGQLVVITHRVHGQILDTLDAVILNVQHQHGIQIHLINHGCVYLLFVIIIQLAIIMGNFPTNLVPHAQIVLVIEWSVRMGYGM